MNGLPAADRGANNALVYTLPLFSTSVDSFLLMFKPMVTSEIVQNNYIVTNKGSN